MDTPKMIWAKPNYDGEFDGMFVIDGYPIPPSMDSGAFKYVLATEHDRIVADRDAEIERMRHDRDNWRGLAKIALAQFDALSEMAPPPQKGLLLRRIKELAEIRALKESPDA